MAQCFVFLPYLSQHNGTYLQKLGITIFFAGFWSGYECLPGSISLCYAILGRAYMSDGQKYLTRQRNVILGYDFVV